MSTANCTVYPNPPKVTESSVQTEITVAVTGILCMIHIAVFDLFGYEMANVNTECPSACESRIDITDLASRTQLVRITTEANFPSGKETNYPIKVAM